MTDWTSLDPYLARMNSAELWQDRRVEPKPNLHVIEMEKAFGRRPQNCTCIAHPCECAAILAKYSGRP